LDVPSQPAYLQSSKGEASGEENLGGWKETRGNGPKILSVSWWCGSLALNDDSKRDTIEWYSTTSATLNLPFLSSDAPLTATQLVGI